MKQQPFVLWGDQRITHIRFLGITANPEFWIKHPHFTKKSTDHLAEVDTQYKGKIFAVDKLPKGFTIQRAWGLDFFLLYNKNGRSTHQKHAVFRRPLIKRKNGRFYDVINKTTKLESLKQLRKDFPMKQVEKEQ